MNLKKRFLKRAFLGLVCLSMSIGLINAASYYCDPASGNINNSGSSSSPWRTLEEVFNANKIFSPGDIIYLRNGYHGYPTVKGHNTGYVTIQAQSGHSPAVKKLIVANGSRWVISGLTISPEVVSSYEKGTFVSLEASASYITLENCFIYSALSSAGWSAADWGARTGFGIVSRAPNCLITNNYIKNIGFAVDNYATGVNSVFSYNTLENVMNDGFRGLANYTKYEYNIVKNFYVLNVNHDDGFQSWSGDGAGGPGTSSIYGIEVRGNTFLSYTDPNQPYKSEMQGIGCFDGMFRNFIIENNLVSTDMWHGIALFGATNCRVVNNTVVKNPINFYGHQPWIQVRHHKNLTPASNNLVRNNLVRALNNDNTYGNIGTVDHNIQTTNYTAHFINYSGQDYRLKSTSSARDAGSTSLAPTIDLNKYPRSGNPDIGCYEYGSVPTGGDEEAPSTPGTPVVTGNSIASVSLSWSASTDNIGVVGYNIYVNGGFSQTSTGTSATVGGLEPGTSYSFTVSAFDAASNESSQSGSVSGSTENGSEVSVASVTASADDGNVPANTIDDNLNTRWSAFGDGQWIQYQLSGAENLTAIGIAFYSGSSRISDFDIQVSSNGTSWTTVFSGSSSGTTNNIELFDFTSTTASYIRYLGHGNSVNDWNSLTEVKIYASGPVDTQAPSVPTGLAVGTVTTSSIALSWNASTDNIAVTGYKVYTNGSNPQTVGGTSTTIGGLADNTTYNFTVSAFDAASNESSQSSSVQATTDEITGVTSSSTWQSFSESTQTGEFTATFTAVPSGNNIDALTGIQNGSASAYGDVACIIRFNSSGNIDARDGGAYSATNTVSYSQGTTYSFRVEVNVTSHTYDVFVTPQGGSEQIVASDFAFRTEQASVSQLTGWCVYAYIGSHTVDNMTFSTQGGDTEAPSVPTGLVSSNVTTNSVDLSWTASTDNVGVTGYKVYTNGSNPQTVGGTSATISGLSANTQYSFTVSAVDAASNESLQSSAEVVTTQAQGGVDLISNGEFDSGTTDWLAGNYAGTATISAVTGQGMSGTNALQVSISAAGTNPWDIQIYQDIEIESGHTYEISFLAKAASNRDIDVVIQDTDSPWAEYWHEDISLTTSSQSFGPFTFNSSTTDATCRFKFFVAGNASTVYVDDVVVTDVTQSSSQFELASSEASFKLYPNPLSSDVLKLELNGYNEEINVAIFDMMGRVVYNTTENIIDNTVVEIPSNVLNQGIYIISVNGESINIQQKLIVE